MNGLSYAYLGDAVYELKVREHLINKGIFVINKLHNEAVKFTSAKSQSYVIRKLIDDELLSEKEYKMFKLGRNSDAKQGKKSASMMEYKHSTGLESLIGYLYIKDIDRLNEIMRIIIKTIEER
ncbi:Mini-ribonuclease 3 [Mycoplasmatota bacterium]|nr:Mini-ribonuclease 3 [Mycoplasmatota bacterium]